jgi:hypothetical protein
MHAINWQTLFPRRKGARLSLIRDRRRSPEWEILAVSVDNASRQSARARYESAPH